MAANPHQIVQILLRNWCGFVAVDYAEIKRKLSFAVNLQRFCSKTHNNKTVIVDLLQILTFQLNAMEKIYDKS